MTIIFKKIRYGNIFTRDFCPFECNNRISFPSSEEIAVIYGPNGTGKTSFIKVLSDAPKTEVEFEYLGVMYSDGNTVFHVVNDQNNRNIIAGETRDFFLGDNIQREFELQEILGQKRESFISSVISKLKECKISAKNNPLTDLIKETSLRELIKDFSNNKSKGSQHSNEQIIRIVGALKRIDIPDYDQSCLDFLIKDYGEKKSVLLKVEAFAGKSLLPNQHVREIEENTDAIAILNKYRKEQCVVCDTFGIDRETLLEKKKANRDTIKKALDPKVRELLDEITDRLHVVDPFDLKQRLLMAIEDGDMTIVSKLIDEINTYKEVFASILQNAIIDEFIKAGLEATFYEYRNLIDKSPDISEEDYLYIQEIVANSMNKTLKVERDEKKRLHIRLSDQDFLGLAREELPLSSGEQNFLSLTFEFLKAKNSAAPIVVIDDPISSFDSIYKNKVVYAMIKMLHNKKRIVLTHNTDLIRLLDDQRRSCFNLYLLNNTDGEMNGFIPLCKREQSMLINLEKLLDGFRNDVQKQILDLNLFLIAMIPFMRGYAKIVGRNDIVDKLTQVMHGYKNECVDIANSYIELFGNRHEKIPTSYSVSVSDILNKTLDNICILKTQKFPLLDRTLKHSFQYLYLRLAVERELVHRFNIDTEKNKQLGQIISAAFPDDTDSIQMRNRVKLTSKKTLINEFNHFEGNMSIFQPAIDITDKALEAEKSDILKFIDNLRERQSNGEDGI